MELNKIYNEDCLDTMRKMPEKFIDLTITSPPYDGLRVYNGYVFGFEAIAKELFRVTKEGGIVVWVIADATIKGSETGTSFKQALYFKEIGFNLHDTMIWNKPNPIPTQSNRYQQSFEYMFVFSKGKPKAFNPILEQSKTAGRKRVKHRAVKGAHLENEEGIYVTKDFKIPGNVMNVSVMKNETKHPAIFPEELCLNHIQTWSNEGDLVYDPFMGSGTTAKISHLKNRNWIGSEISSKYIEMANNRLKPILNQTTIF